MEDSLVATLVEPSTQIVEASSATNTKKDLIDQSSKIDSDSFVEGEVISEALSFDQVTENDSVEEALLSAMAEDQVSEEKRLEYQKQFIREYLAQAQRQGYDIKLNNQLQVISIKKRKTYEPILIEEVEE